MLGSRERRGRPQTPGEDLGLSGGAEPWRLDGCRRRVPHVQIGVISEFTQGVTVGCGSCEWVTAQVRTRDFRFRIAPFGRLARRRGDRPTAWESFASPSKYSTSASSRSRVSDGELSRSSLVPLRPVDGRRSSARRQASSARRSIGFIARTSILALGSDREERRLDTRCRTHAPRRSPPAGRTRRPGATTPWVSRRSSSARICFSSASETRLRLAHSPQRGHVPRSGAHEKRQPQKQATSISDCLSRPPVFPADASFGL